MTGTCKYCGQTMITEVHTQEAADQIATDECKCQEGREYRNLEEMKREARQNAYALFSSQEMPDKEEALLDTMNSVIEAVAAGVIKKATLKLDERTTASIFITAQDGIKIKKNYKEEYVLEAYRL